MSQYDTVENASAKQDPELGPVPQPLFVLARVGPSGTNIVGDKENFHLLLNDRTLWHLFGHLPQKIRALGSSVQDKSDENLLA